jgi:hypothetical protein
MRNRLVIFIVFLLFIACSFGRVTNSTNIKFKIKLDVNSDFVINQIDKIALIIESNLYSKINSKINRYIDDVESRFPVELILHKVKVSQNQNPLDRGSKSPEDIRNILKNEYKANKIKGALLIGQIPFATWEQEVGENVGVSSIFYEDMDGSFEDRDMNGHYDYHNFGPNEGPEIWISWMRPPALGQVIYLSKLLDKTHSYYTGELVTNKKAFVACHEDYDNNFYGALGVVPPLEDIYGSENVEKDGEGADTTIDSEIWNNLENVGYEIFDTWQHASSGFQAWDYGGFHSSKVMNLEKGSLMTFLYGCHSADFWESPGTSPFNINIAVSYVFGNSICQAASGTSWSYGTEYKFKIYEDMRDNNSYLGKAWLNMESYVETESFVKKRYPDRDPHTECAGNNLIGNPFLFVNYTGNKKPIEDVNNKFVELY